MIKFIFEVPGVVSLSVVEGYIKNFDDIDVLWWTLCITSAKRSAHDNIFIFFWLWSTGMESVTISSVNLDS